MPKLNHINFNSPLANETGTKERIDRYIESAPAAVEGQHGDNTTLTVLRNMFAAIPMSETEQRQAAWQYNAEKCVPQWDEKDLQRLYQQASKYARHQTADGSLQTAVVRKQPAASSKPKIAPTETPEIDTDVPFVLFSEIAGKQCSFYRNLKNKVPEKQMTIAESLKFLKDGIPEVITARNTPDKKSYQYQKQNLPVLMFGGISEGRHTAADTTPNGFCIIDIDFVAGIEERDFVRDIYDVLRGRPHILAFGLSTSGKGYYALTYSETLTFAEQHQAVADDLASFGIVIDKACKDVSRLRFASHDPNQFIRDEFQPLAWKENKPVVVNANRFKPFEELEVDLDEIEQQSPLDNSRAIPDNLLHPGGLMEKVMRYILDTNFIRQPEYALAASIALQAHLVGQNYRTSDDVRSNIYVLALGGTSTGKNRQIQVLRQCLEIEHRASSLSRGWVTNFASMQAMYNELTAHPVLMSVWDECGKELKRVNDKRNMNLQGIYTLLLELYSSANGSTTTPAKANEQSKHLNQPHFCWFGTGTPEDVMNAFTTDNVDDGLIARINFFYASPAHKNKLRQHITDIPPLPADIENEIIEWASRIPNKNDRKLGRLFACPDTAPYTEQAIAVFRELETELEHLEKRYPESCVIAGKTIEEAKKLALIAACSEFRENPQIDGQHARWGADLALFLAKRKMNIAESEIGKTDYVKKTERVMNIVRKKIETKGRCTETDLCVALQQWTKKEKHIVIEGMINGGMIKREKLCKKFKPVFIYSPVF